MLEQILKIFEVNTDAVATNKGFYYQYLTILKKWIENFINNKNIDSFTEVDQDIKEVGENLLFTQVKCYSSNFSLNSKEIKNTIFDFFFLYLKNKDLGLNQRFCFATNTKVAVKENLLRKWISDEEMNDEELRKLCVNKIKEILTKEIKTKKNKRLSQNISDVQRGIVKSSAENFIKLVNAEVENFTKAIQWKFENLSPDEAIQSLKKEIDKLLENKKYKNRPKSLLFGVFISEIYKRSQINNPNERVLTKQVMLDILNHSDEELEGYLDIRFFKLIKLDIESLQAGMQKIQSQVDVHDTKITLLEKNINFNSLNELPKELNLIPDYNSVTIYDWDDFLNDVKTRLTDKKLLSVHSEGGMGKTSFAKKYIKTYTDYHHIIWITVDTTISNSFVFDSLLLKNINIEFSSDEDIEQRFKTILSKLNSIQGENLIVIDIQELEEDFASLRHLTTLSNWQKLILTRNHLKTIPTLKLPKLSFESAKNIYFTYNTKADTVDRTLVEFIEFIDFNVLVIELTAKTIENSIDLNLEDFLTSLKEQNLDDEELNIDIDLSENNSSVRIFNYLLKKFSLTNLNPNEDNYLEFLALLPSRDIIIDDIILFNGVNHYKENKIYIGNMLNVFDRKGLIEFTADRKRINLHKIIKEVVLYNAREKENPFSGIWFFITWLTSRIQENQNNPSLSFRYLRYAQSILDNIKEEYRKSIYQSLIMLENELLYSYKFFMDSGKELPKWIDLASRAEKSPMLEIANVGVIYNNLGLSYASEDNNKAIEQFKKAFKLFQTNEQLYKAEIITTLNNITVLYLNNEDLNNGLNNFKIVQDFRQKYNLYDDQQIVIEYKILAESYKICGDLKMAIGLISQGIQIHYTLEKEKRNDFFLSIFYNYLSSLFLIDKDLDSGILHQENSVHVLEEMNFHNSEHLLKMYQVLRNLYKVKGDNEKVEFIAAKIKSIFGNI